MKRQSGRARNVYSYFTGTNRLPDDTLAIKTLWNSVPVYKKFDMDDTIHHAFTWSPNGLLIFNIEHPAPPSGWLCTIANQAACNLLGRLPLDGLPMADLFPTAIAEHFGDAALTYPLNHSVDFFVSEQGRWLLASANKMNGLLTIALTDITRQKEAAFSDHRLMRLYRSLTGSLDDNEIILFDKNFNILLNEGNPRFIRVGIEENLNGWKLNTLFESNNFTFLNEYVTNVFSGGRTEVEKEISGKFYKASVYSHAGDDDDQENIIGVLLLKDVSELNRKQRELEVRVHQLDRSNRELQQFAYVASHDLQEPLRKIMSFGERLTRKYGDLLMGEGQEYITRMNNAAQRMEALINDLLSFSRATRSDLPFEPTDLNDILAEVLTDMDAAERTKAIITLPDNLPVVEAIPSQMRQLFQNLLNNALKFTKAGQLPVVDIRHRRISGADLPAVPALLPEKSYSVIEIQDQGIGFDPINAERIFTIFQRLHGRSEYDGTGVGLAICKKIVVNHEGVIFADATVGQGALFTVILPFKQH